jgi:hypothetical protein
MNLDAHALPSDADLDEQGSNAGSDADWPARAPQAAAALGGLAAHHLRVRLAVTRPVRLQEHQGAALRGALFGALRSRFCVRQELTSCQPCTLHAVCPISALVATVDDASRRGLDVPRPFALQPSLDRRVYYPAGGEYRFGLTIFGRGIDNLPYALVGLQDLGTTGFGLRGPNGIGQLRLDRIDAWNPITGARSPVYGGGVPAGTQGEGAAKGRHGTGTDPSVPVTHGDVLRRAGSWLGRDRLTLQLLTPLRLATRGEPLRHFSFGVFVRRLVDRLETLAAHYGAPAGTFSPLGPEGAAALGGLADAVRIVEDRTRWVEVQSYSNRQRRKTPLSGLAGQVTLEGKPERLAPLLPWLAWGEIAHAGKDATRGNGWYQMVER